MSLSRPDRAGFVTRIAALSLAVAATACGRADVPAAAPAGRAARVDAPAAPLGPQNAVEAGQSASLDAATALCRQSAEGFLRARLQGAVVAEIDWSAPTTPQCVGGPRPTADGVRLVYKGAAGPDRLVVIFGVALPRDTRSARNVPANVTVVREGAGQFFATQGDDKCALDDVAQEPVAGHAGRYRLTGRGFCTQPARTVAGDDAGAVLVSRFDVGAVVEYPPEH